jgi:hypothetical protein
LQSGQLTLEDGTTITIPEEIRGMGQLWWQMTQQTYPANAGDCPRVPARSGDTLNVEMPALSAKVYCIQDGDAPADPIELSPAFDPASGSGIYNPNLEYFLIPDTTNCFMIGNLGLDYPASAVFDLTFERKVAFGILTNPIPTPLTFTGRIYPDKPELRESDGVFEFRNIGTAPFDYLIRGLPSWLTVTSPTTGRLDPDGLASILVTATCPGQDATSYTGTVTIEDTTNNKQESLNVELKCVTGPAISEVTPQEISITAIDQCPGDGLCYGPTGTAGFEYFTFTSLGAEDLMYTVRNESSAIEENVGVSFVESYDASDPDNLYAYSLVDELGGTLPPISPQQIRVWVGCQEEDYSVGILVESNDPVRPLQRVTVNVNTSACRTGIIPSPPTDFVAPPTPKPEEVFLNYGMGFAYASLEDDVVIYSLYGVAEARVAASFSKGAGIHTLGTYKFKLEDTNGDGNYYDEPKYAAVINTMLEKIKGFWTSRVRSPYSYNDKYFRVTGASYGNRCQGALWERQSYPLLDLEGNYINGLTSLCFVTHLYPNPTYQ